MDQMDARELFARKSRSLLSGSGFANLDPFTAKAILCHSSVWLLDWKFSSFLKLITKPIVSASSPEVERYERDDDDRENREPGGDDDDRSRDGAGREDEAIEVPAPKVIIIDSVSFVHFEPV